VYEILKHSTKYKFHFFEVNTAEEMLRLAEEHHITSIIYNWHPSTSPWCTPRFVKRRSEFNQFLIEGHELYAQQEMFENIKAFITIDPTLPQTDIRYPGIRPITYYPHIKYKPQFGKLKIGTSGFGQQKKGFDRLVQILNDQFKDEEIELNVHFSVGHYVDPSGNAAKDALAAKIKLNDNIKLNITHAFFEKHELISWLNSNDINVYCYDFYDGPGVSSSIDKAIAAKKPFAVNDSNYFKHVRKDEIDINKTPIKEIVKSGIDPVLEFYDKWNPTTFLNQYEFLLDTYDV
jgi:hypothetical protein